MAELIIRLVASLAVVVGLMLLLARFAGKRYGGRTGAPVQVLHRQPLSRSSSVAVISVGSRVLVVGTTDHQVSLLTELDPDELDLQTVPLEAEVLETGELGTSAPVTEGPGIDGSRIDGSGTQGSASAGQKTRGLTTTPQAGALNGSVLSPQTWRQAFSAAKDRVS